MTIGLLLIDLETCAEINQVRVLDCEHAGIYFPCDVGVSMTGMNNWDLFDLVEGKGSSFQELKKRLKLKYGTNPVKVVQWGFKPSGVPYAIVQSDRPVTPPPVAPPPASTGKNTSAG